MDSNTNDFRFLVLTTLTDRVMVDSTCGRLEQAGIPVLLEHIHILEGQSGADGVRVLVPSEFAEKALHLIKPSGHHTHSHPLTH